MPDETSARLWGLRAGCESLLRQLTHAQKSLEDYGRGDLEVLPKLRSQVAGIASDCRMLCRDADEAADHVTELPHAEHVRVTDWAERIPDSTDASSAPPKGLPDSST